MNIDPGAINKALDLIPYPVGKANLIQLARQHGVNDQLVGMLDKLPDKTFNSSQEVQELLTGGLGNLGGLFKR